MTKAVFPKATQTLPGIRGVLFDLDNTLYDRDAVFAMWARGFVDEYFAKEALEGRAEILKRILALDARGYRTRAALFTDLKALYPFLPDVEALCSLFYAQWLAHMVLDAATVRLLDALDAFGIPFGIITNGSLQQNLKIDRLGLRARTACLFISEEFGVRKPEAAIFQAAAVRLNLPHEQILFVGDNPELDICGANAVGMRTAWLHRDQEWPARIADVKPDLVIGSLGELLATLEP